MNLADVAGLGVLTSSFSVGIIALTRYLIVKAALRDTKPEQRPAILRTLPQVLATSRATPPPAQRPRTDRHRWRGDSERSTFADVPVNAEGRSINPETSSETAGSDRRRSRGLNSPTLLPIVLGARIGRRDDHVGSSKGRRGAGQRRAAKVKSRRRRLAEDEAVRERHARLVVERADDPRFVQQETFPGRRRVRWSPETPTGAKLSEAIEEQLAAFGAKFGRDPGPNDPLFFDPDVDEPTPLPDGAWHDALEEMITKADQIGLDPAYLKAWRELGYIITESNQHLFSAAGVQAWSDAVEKYQGRR